MTARSRILPALVAVALLTLPGCASQASSTAAPAAAPLHARSATAGTKPAAAAATKPRQASPAGPAAGSRAAGRQARSSAKESVGPAQTAREHPLTDLVLRPGDLGRSFLMQKPDDAAAATAPHEFCAGRFRSDAQRRSRVERNFAREDGLRVQQELNRYATATDAERALQEFATSFQRCSSYQPQPGLQIELTPWDAPQQAQQRAGARMTLRQPAQPTIHAALAAYRSGDLLMVLSVVAEQPETASTWHAQVVSTAIHRALMAPGQAPEETR